MTNPLLGRDFLKESDFTADEFGGLGDLAVDLKGQRRTRSEVQHLRGKLIALIFEKTSTRTRCAFEVGAYEQGAHVTYLDPASSQLGRKESVADTARVLSRLYDAIEYRGALQSTVETLAEYADVPVYNGLTDEWHPTQMLADLMTMREHSPVGTPFSELTYCYLGDARSNMGNSIMMTGAIMGADVRIGAPRELWPDADVQALARERAAASGARITLTENVDEAVNGAAFVHTDVWVSMGEPADVWDERVRLLRPYRVTSDVMRATGIPTAHFMHCLPAFHDTETTVGRDVAERTGLHDGIEVTSEVFDSPANIALDQAENRLHTIKAVMVATLGDHGA